MANERDRIKYLSKTVQIECKQAANKEECMELLDEEKATMTTLDAGSVFIGGRYHSLVPIAQEVFENGQTVYFSVAVIKKGGIPDVFALHHLRGRKACFPGVETFAGWVLPINTVSFLIFYNSSWFAEYKTDTYLHQLKKCVRKHKRAYHLTLPHWLLLHHMNNVS